MPRSFIPSTTCAACGARVYENLPGGPYRCAACGSRCDACECARHDDRCPCGATLYDSRGVRRCQICGERPDDCGCGPCENCGAVVEYRTPDGYCEACANPPDDPGERDPDSTWHGEPSARFPYFVGVEIECGVTSWSSLLRETMDKWGVGLHDDGSVRVNGHSHELVTAPARGDSFERQIDELCCALHGAEAHVNRSCGLHVHVDVRPFTTAQILGIVRLYSRIEKTLYGLVARSRRSNNFAGPWGERLTEGAVLDTEASITDRERALDINTYGSEREARNAKECRYKHSSRYHGFNLNAIAVHGTLEFRLHHGTVNASKIKMWAAVCSAVVRYGAEHPESDIAALRGTPAEILERVLGEDRALIGWTRARRRFFEDRERERRGLPPRRAARTARAATIPVVDPGAIEDGEGPLDGGRVGRRAL